MNSEFVSDVTSSEKDRIISKLSAKISDLSKDNYKLRRKNNIKGKVIVCETILMLSMLAHIMATREKNNKYHGNGEVSYSTVLPTPSPTPKPTPQPTPAPTVEPISTPEPIPEPTPEPYDSVIRLDAEDWTGLDDYRITKEYYYDSLARYANTYGVDPNLTLAICCQEKKIHSDVMDPGGGLGLFQIQVSVWQNNTIDTYKIVDGKIQTERVKFVVFPGENEQYDSEGTWRDSDGTLCVNVSNVFGNMRAGCIIIQYVLEWYDGDVLLAILAYNYGTTYTDSILRFTSTVTDMSIEELKKSPNYEFLQYCDSIKDGDSNYPRNVLKFVADGTIFTNTNRNGEEKSTLWDNTRYSKEMSR